MLPGDRLFNIASNTQGTRTKWKGWCENHFSIGLEAQPCTWHPTRDVTVRIFFALPCGRAAQRASPKSTRARLSGPHSQRPTAAAAPPAATPVTTRRKHGPLAPRLAHTRRHPTCSARRPSLSPSRLSSAALPLRAQPRHGGLGTAALGTARSARQARRGGPRYAAALPPHGGAPQARRSADLVRATCTRGL